MFEMEIRTKSKKKMIVSVIINKDYMKIKFNSDDNLTIKQTTKISFNDHNYQICF